MMTVIGIILVALVSVVFILIAIAPMIAEARPAVTVKRAKIVPMAQPIGSGNDLHQADAA